MFTLDRQWHQDRHHFEDNFGYHFWSGAGVYLTYLLVFNREVLDTEPGDVTVFTH